MTITVEAPALPPVEVSVVRPSVTVTAPTLPPITVTTAGAPGPAGPAGPAGDPGPAGVPPPETDANSNTQYGLNSGMYAAGNGNSAVGQQALQVVFGAYNSALGYNAGKEINYGGNNVAVGTNALYSAGGDPARMTFNQSHHVGVGANSGAYTPGTGDAVTAIGGYAVAHTEGVALGYDAQARGVSSVAIGARSRATLDNQIMLGTAAQTVEAPGAFKVAGSPVWKAWTGTQAAYDAIGTKDPGTLYVVTG